MDITLEKQADVENQPVPLRRILGAGQSIQDFFFIRCIGMWVWVRVYTYIYISQKYKISGGFFT